MLYLSLFSTGGGGEVYCWDLRQLACRYKFPDSGAVAGTAVAASRDHLATGSDSGVVNIYRNRYGDGITHVTVAVFKGSLHVILLCVGVWAAAARPSRSVRC